MDIEVPQTAELSVGRRRQRDVRYEEQEITRDLHDEGLRILHKSNRSASALDA